jgi:hypothetical protein
MPTVPRPKSRLKRLVWSCTSKNCKSDLQLRFAVEICSYDLQLRSAIVIFKCASQRARPASGNMQSAAHSIVRGAFLSSPTENRALWKNSEVLIAHCDLIYRADECCGANIGLLAVLHPHIANLIPRRNHRVLQTGIHQIGFVGAM